MSQDQWTAFLSFLSAALVAATQIFQMSPELEQVIEFSVVVIGLALGYFFGAKPIVADRRARKSAEHAAKPDPDDL